MVTALGGTDTERYIILESFIGWYWTTPFNTLLHKVMVLGHF